MRGRKKIDSDRMKKAVALYQGGFSVQQVVEISGISRSTIYRELDKLGISLRDDDRKTER
ncbi:helix-turn-helix domain-containing protein [Adlercreutzia sp. ZJ242]|uniref:helix-turn-helix domain-containing protein n=1 Tax=Adlercreutzia sp. ZJ242 TaxID=2709409 RepID=UPI00197E732B